MADRTMTMTPRRHGKSELSRLMVEAALDAGKTVGICTSEHMLIKKRRKHLTSITTVTFTPRKPIIWSDPDG